MSSVVFDASAVIALLRSEPGSDRLLDYLPSGVISTVNLAEVFSKSADIELTLEQAKWAVQRLQLRQLEFDDSMAYVTGSLREATRHLGLSLGDRACLASGIALQAPVVTRDRDWKELDVGVDVIVVRDDA